MTSIQQAVELGLQLAVEEAANGCSWYDRSIVSMEMSRIHLLSCLVVAALVPCVSAQSLKLQSAVVRKGEAGSLFVILDSPAAGAPVSLQWDLILPKDITASLNDIVMDGALESVNKSLACAAKLETPPRYSCMVAGGNKAVPNGPIAVVRYRIAVEVRKVSGKVRMENAVGVKSDGSPINFANVEQAIAVK
jgi:hypothetical protein